jgi:hypothetical protein
MMTAPIRSALRLLPLAATLFAACAQEATPVPDDLLADAPPFAAVPNGSGAEGAGAGAGAYLAIRKDVLERTTSQVRNRTLFVADVAYPIVDVPAFTALPGSDRYVLVDPSADLKPRAGNGPLPNPDPIDPVF